MMTARDTAGEDRVVAGLDDTRRVLAHSRVTRARLVRELDELMANLHRLRDAHHDGPRGGPHHGEGRDDARI